jgi:hypothetical protein
MQQRQLRLGDILDDYCPRERRVTNHAVVAMVGADVKQTRCTTCDAEHEFKHAKVPRQRRKADTPAALYAQVAANGPKRVAHEHDAHEAESALPLHDEESEVREEREEDIVADDLEISDNGNQPAYPQTAESDHPVDGANAGSADGDAVEEDGPVHRPLIRASLPRPEGQQPPARPIPEFTIRQPAGRPGSRFRPRHQRGGQQGQQFGGNRGNGNFAGGPPRGMRSGSGGRPQGAMPMGRRQGAPGRKRSK